MPSKLLTALLLSSVLFAACSTQTSTDTDRDNIVNANDNCPAEANPDQADLDKDGLGDICDPDIDGDGFSNEKEVIAETDGRDPKSFPQLDADDDRDGVPNNADKCPDTKVGRRVDDDGCEAAKIVLKDNYSDEINLNPPHTEPMLPKWAFGYMQSGWGEENAGYDNQQNFLDHARALRGIDNQYGKHKHPADIMVLDMYWTGKEWGWPGNMTWDYNAFPDPKGLIKTLHKLDFKIMMNYHEGGFGDEWLEKLQRDLDMGLDIVWLDFWKGGSDYETQVWELLRNHHGENKRIAFMARHYARPNNHNQEAILGGDYMRKPDEDEIEKTMPFHWTGDVLSTWAGFAETIDAIVYSEEGAMGGWSYLHSDTPGHTEAFDPELAIRWIQFSDFTTGTRNHGTTPRDVWSWGPEIEEYSYHSRMLRYRLLPYIYTYAWEIWEKAIPMTRPIKFAYPGEADDLRFQFMFGNELLVAPVYKTASDFPDEQMDVYLPKNEEWINYWDHKVHPGGQTIKVPVGKDHFKYVPLFVKRGAIIPMGPEIFHIDPKKHADPITLDIYPKTSGESSFTLYDDDGETLDYQKGKHAQTKFTVARNSDGIKVSVGATEGKYKGMPKKQNYVLKINLIDDSYSKVTINNSNLQKVADYNDLLGTKSKKIGWALDEANKTLYVRFRTAVAKANEVNIGK